MQPQSSPAVYITEPSYNSTGFPRFAQARQELLFHVRFEARWTRILLFMGQYVRPQKYSPQSGVEREERGQDGECRGSFLILRL